MTLEQLQQIIPNAGAKAGVFLDELNAAMAEFDITTPLRQAAFVANVGHESQQLNRLVENLNYRPDAILEKFNTSNVQRFTPEQAQMYGRTSAHAANQEMIANIAYANRMGNGDVDSGDGWRHRGMGGIQATGKTNQYAIADHFGIPREEVGAWLQTPEGAMRSAAYFWWKNNLNEIADRGDIKLIRKRVNGGTFGLGETVEIYERAQQVLGA